MNVIINKTPTAVLFKAYLEQLISEYHEANKELESSYRTANKQYKDGVANGVYTDEHLRRSLDLALGVATDQFFKSSERLNIKAKNYISELKKKIVPALSETEKPSDYAVRVNNALQFVQVEGAEIDDATAFQILHDFEKDVETMQRFRSVIEHQKGEKLSDAYGRTTFPLTFGRLEKCEQLIEALAELEATADRLFIRQKAETETEYTPHGVKLSVPMDSYSQLIGEKNAAEQAETVEKMVGELFTVTE